MKNFCTEFSLFSRRKRLGTNSHQMPPRPAPASRRRRDTPPPQRGSGPPVASTTSGRCARDAPTRAGTRHRAPSRRGKRSTRRPTRINAERTRTTDRERRRRRRRRRRRNSSRRCRARPSSATRRSPTTFSPFLSRDDAITPRELCVAALLFPLACARAVALVAHLVAFAAISKLKLLGLPRDVQRGDAPTPRWRETLFYLAFRALMTSCLLSVGVLVRVRGRDEIRRVLHTGPHTTAFAR